jgi:ribonuclease P protein component
MAIRYTFKVYERLKREQHINTLFLSGKAFSVFPVRFIYALVPRPADASSPAQAGFSVPKKKFRSSVHRHRIRRLMVEAWRLHKHTIYPAIPESMQLHLFFIFTDKLMPDGYEPVKEAILKGLAKLTDIITPKPESNTQQQETSD